MLFLKTSHTLVLRSAKYSLGLRPLATQASIKLSDEAIPLDTEWLSARPYSEIPKPSKFDLFTSFLPGGKHHNKSISEYVESARKEFGDIFVMPGMFGRPDVLMAFDPNDFAKVFRTEGVWPVRTGLETLVHFRSVVRKDYFGDNIGLVVSQGENWANQRKILNPVMVQPRNAKLYINTLDSVNDQFIERIRDIRDPTTQEVPGNFEEDLTRLAFESITSIALNADLGLIRRQKENPEALKLFKNIRQFTILVFELEIQPSMWRTVGTPKYYKFMRCQEEILQITEKFINDAIVEIEKQQTTDREPSLLEKLLKIDKKTAIVNAMDMLIAGVDGTTSLLAGILLCLSKNPAKQEILRKEIISVLPEKNTPLTIESMKNMPYLRACIKESLRVYPVLGGNFRDIGRDIVLGGYQVPKGTRAFLSNNLLKDERYYSRPEEFLPERWLRHNEGAEVVQDSHQPFTFIPFGFGPRICAGKRIVDIELEVAVAKVLRNFKVEFNYSAEKPFRQYFGNVPAIPLKFKFSDV